MQTIQQFRKYASFKYSDLLCVRENSVVPDTAQCSKFRPCSAKASIQLRPNTAIVTQETSQIKQRLLRNHIISIGFFDACFTSHWKHFQFDPIQLQPIHTPSLFDALHVKTCDRWLLRLLHLEPSVGRPRQQWDDMLKTFCQYQRVGEWELAAQDACHWETLMPEFINFSIGSCRSKFERQIPLLCTCNSFSPVHFVGRLRACTFHSLTGSLNFPSMVGMQG